MHIVRPCIVAVSLSSAVAWCTPALACGALPTPSFAFAGLAPEDGALGVVRDAPLVFRLTCALEPHWTPIVRDAACAHLPTEMKVELTKRGSAEALPGKSFAHDGALLFVPDAPLERDSDYDVRARLDRTAGDLTVSSELRSTFRTGAALLAPFQSVAPHTLTVESYDAPVARCHDGRLVGDAAKQALGPQICPTHADCRAHGSERAARFRAVWGPFSGGAESLPYAVELTVGDVRGLSFSRLPALFGLDGSEPRELAVSELAFVRAGERVELMLDVPPSDPDALLCVRVRAADASGEVRVAEERCATHREWRQPLSTPPNVEQRADASMVPSVSVRAPDAGRARADEPALPSSQEATDAKGAEDGGPGEAGCRTTRGAAATHALPWLLGVSLLLRRRRTG